MSRQRPHGPGPDQKLRKVATDFWFAVQRMGRRGQGSSPSAADAYPPGDDGPQADGGDQGWAGSGMPRRPAPSSGSASAAAIPENEDEELL